jgi:hypothetical protein
MDLVLKKYFDGFISKGTLPVELNIDECKNFKLFDDFKVLNDWRNPRKGLWYEDSEKNVLHGGLDNVLVNTRNGNLIVLDYKTRGFPLKEDTASHYQNQLDTYAFLLEKSGRKVEDFAYLLFYYPKEVLENGYFLFNHVLRNMNVNPQNAKEGFSRAISLLKDKCPDKTCSWCEGRPIKK